MTIYLLRHGKAEPYNPGGDSARELTERGIEQSRAMGRLFKGKLNEVEKVLCSPYVRARQTAELFTAEAEHYVEISERDCLTPLEDPWEIMHELNEQRWENVLLAGHNPHLSALSSFMVTGGRDQLELKTGSLIVIDWPRGGQPGDGTLKAFIPSKFIL